jgi:putative hydrolase of the HAD superfamily
MKNKKLKGKSKNRMLKMKNNHIKVIAFDADDTLWDCQGHFERVMQHLYDELTPWVDRETAAMELFATERKNMYLLGYGVKAFTLSMLETAMRVSRNEMPAATINDILQQCYGLLQFPCTPLPEVEETLQVLRHHITTHPSALTSLIVFTKGELLDQEHKLERSGLAPYFDHVEITSDKGEKEFRDLCRKLSIRPDELLMVGNSLKSDIAPALAIGAWAVYIPFHVTWQLEHHDDFEHERLIKIEQFSELLNYL